MSLRGECRFRVGTWELVRGPAESAHFSTAFPGRPDDTDAGRLRREGHSGRPRHRRCHARTHLHVNCGGLRCARVRLKGTGQSGCLLIPARISRARSSLRVAFREAWPFRFARVASCAYGRGRRARSRECSTHLSCSAIGGCSFACACRTRRVRWVGLLNDRGKRTDDLIGTRTRATLSGNQTSEGSNRRVDEDRRSFDQTSRKMTRFP